MKLFKKIMALVVAAMIVTGMSAAAIFAQNVSYPGSGTSDGSITIMNAAKGETYKIYKLFDATLGSSGAVAYTGDIPSSLSSWFVPAGSGTGYVKYRDSGTTELPEAARTAIKAWASSSEAQVLAQATSDGSILTFAGLPYGYYVVTTTQGDQVISVDTTKPHAEIYDKNNKVPDANKTVEQQSYSIGDTVKYTAVFNTANFIGAGKDAKQVVEYVISDTLPEFIDPDTVEIISISIHEPSSSGSSNGSVGNLIKEIDSGTTFTDKQYTVPWATLSGSDYVSIYPNGAAIKVVYSGVLTKVVKYDGPNINTVSIQPYGASGSEKNPISGSYKDSAEVYTYGTALKKTDGSSNPLSGAEFQVAGLIAEETGSGTGVYVVQSYNPEASGTSGTILKVNEDGMLYILGLASGTTLSITETKAPDGYNKLDSPEELPTQVTGSVYTEISGSWYEDENGNRTESTSSGTIASGSTYTVLNAHAIEIENQKGALLPSTGGIGTTIFYVIGAVLVLGAGVLLVTRRRMAA